MSKKKILTIAISVALVAILVVGASLAYFTDTTEQAKNVFTIGKVDIELEEPKWDANLEANNGKYPNLMPGTYVDKDPTVTVADDSEDCWLFVELELSRYVPMFQYLGNAVDGFAAMSAIDKSIALTNAFLKDFHNADWKVMNPEVMNTQPDPETHAWPGMITVILGYQAGDDNGILSAEDEVVIFTKAGLPADLSQENASLFFNTAGQPITGENTIKLNITAKAIQAEGIADLDAAYAALYND
jgi:predicted ribosomally synthesized peptide with SipW-like signal peptide